MRFPSENEAEYLVTTSKRAFQKVLANWAGDVLALKARGLRRPSWSREIPRPIDDVDAPLAVPTPVPNRLRRAA